MHSRLDRISDWRKTARKAAYRVEEIARCAAVTPRELERYFLAAFGTSPKNWIDNLRMQDAQRLLQRGMMIKEVAMRVGLKHPQHFARAFKRVKGSTPSTSRVFEPLSHLAGRE